MGKAIEQIAHRQNVQIAQFFEKKNPLLHPAQLAGVDVAIEFTVASMVKDHAAICFEAKVPMVTGTTGISENDNNEIVTLCQEFQGAFLHASNFSIGMHICFHLNQHLAKIMRNQPEFAQLE